MSDRVLIKKPAMFFAHQKRRYVTQSMFAYAHVLIGIPNMSGMLLNQSLARDESYVPHMIYWLSGMCITCSVEHLVSTNR